MTLAQLLVDNPNPVIVEHVAAMKRMFQFSASQVDTFRDCPRKWAYDRINKVERKQNAAAELGSDVHTLREAWLKHGVMPPEDTYAGLCAKAGLEHLPMPGVATVEVSIRKKVLVAGRDAFYLGYVDFFVKDQGASGYRPTEVPWSAVDGVPLVGDHKTTSRESFIKTPEHLVNEDPQGALYGKWALDHTRADKVDLLWHYIVKNKTPKAVPVRVRATRSEIEHSYLKVLDTAGSMLSIFDTSGIRAEDVEPNPSACDKYGGCPHREYCPLTNQQKIGALMSNGDLEKKLLADAEAAGVKVVPNGNGSLGLAALAAAIKPTAPTTTTTTTEPAAARPGALAALLGTPTLPPTSTAPATTLADVGKQLSEAALVENTAAVVPPDAPPPDLDAVPEEPKKKRGRPKKAALSREDIALQVLLNRLTAGIVLEAAVDEAVKAADLLLIQLAE